MKRINCCSILCLTALLLAGCQFPIVTTRSNSFDTNFLVNGKAYNLKTPYICHHEDLVWFSSRGKDWHIRQRGTIGSAIKISGALEDGTRFEVLPSSASLKSSFCSDKSAPVSVRLFIEIDDTLVESFDSNRKTSSSRRVDFNESRFSYYGAGLDLFSEQQNWPIMAGSSKRYFTIQAVLYDSAAWGNKPDVVNLVRSKKIPWLEIGKTYPFTIWTDSDVEFAKLRQYDPSLNGYSDPAPRIPLELKGENWTFSERNQNVFQWQVEPLPSSTVESNEIHPSDIFKRWITVNGSRIEIPLINYYRTFYQPELDRILEFRVEHVDLWQ